jgi:CRISPR-associated endoribonuclease Cas6
MPTGGEVAFMMQQVQLTVKTADSQRLHSNWGYVLYGILAQHADSAYIADLHQRNETPISQYLEVLPNGTEGIWHICLLGEEAIHQISKVLEQHTQFAAEHHHTTLQILEKNWGKKFSERDFCQQYLTTADVPRRQKLQFLTPTGFKSQEQYQIFPSTELIVKSLWRSWHSYAQELLLDGDDVREQLIQHIHIADYQLRSVRYPVKGNKIPAFQGSIGLQLHGPEPLVRLLNLLLAFGEYSGLGIKTTLGMGGYRLV